MRFLRGSSGISLRSDEMFGPWQGQAWCIAAEGGESLSMMHMRLSAMNCALVVALCLFPCANAQTNTGTALTLDEAIQLARSNNRDLKLYGLDVGKQREAL